MTKLNRALDIVHFRPSLALLKPFKGLLFHESGIGTSTHGTVWEQEKGSLNNVKYLQDRNTP